MKKLAFYCILISLAACGPYSFTGVNTTAQTFQVPFFQNNAPIIEPGLDRDFTLALQDRILNLTNLDLVTNNADLVYEGEIVEYRISPMTATADQRAAQNRLTITVNIRFYNRQNEEDDFERRFSHFFDYPADQQLQQVQDAAYEEIFTRITEDIFNATLAKW